MNNDTSSKLTINSKNEESHEREASPVVPVVIHLKPNYLKEKKEYKSQSALDELKTPRKRKLKIKIGVRIPPSQLASL